MQVRYQAALRPDEGGIIHRLTKFCLNSESFCDIFQFGTK